MKILDTPDPVLTRLPAIDNILSRSSIRSYTSEPITDAQLTAIVHAAMSAPSGVNRQPWEFVVVDDHDLLKQLAQALPYAKMTDRAPVAIIPCGNRERFLDGVDCTLWEQDLSAVSENILLSAHALGLGAVWTCLYPHEERLDPVRHILNLPDRLIPFSLIPIGHPAAPAHPIDKWHPDLIHFNRM